MRRKTGAKSQRSKLKPGVRRICFVTGTRAEFGLMQGVLRAIRSSPKLQLQLIVTGMHLDSTHGRTVNLIRREGWAIDATIPWKSAGDDLAMLARQTGAATARLATAFAKLDPDVVLVTGDRVEAFAAATAAHLGGRVVAHVHGGDRALGQVDDSLRHAITKLAHVHFPATRASAQRLERLGEDPWRIHEVGSPGVAMISEEAWSPDACRSFVKPQQLGRFALVLLHPTEADEVAEQARAELLLDVIRETGFDHIIAVWPNNDPGCRGIITAWEAQRKQPGIILIGNAPRGAFLGLLRDAAVLIGNSSAGIIEAGSFGTPVIDVGPRQQGRERGENVMIVPFRQTEVRTALQQIWNNGNPRRYAKRNIYGGTDTARRMVQVLGSLSLDARLRQKLIAY
jgi:GDP/UDP-N,N'-diacetylbacillosamine 2-epimerase (hydrolysing)